MSLNGHLSVFVSLVTVHDIVPNEINCTVRVSVSTEKAEILQR